MTRTKLPPMMDEIRFVNKREMSRLSGLSTETLKHYRLSGMLPKNIYWIALNTRTVRYCAPLVMDWLKHRDFPEIHQKLLDSYHASLLSYQEETKHK